MAEQAAHDVPVLRGPSAMRVAAAIGYVVLLAPSVVMVLAGLNSGTYLSFPPDRLSLRWVTEFLTGPLFVSYVFSLGLALISTVIATVIGTFAALALSRGLLRRRPSARVLFLAPMTLPGIVIGFALYVFYVVSAIGLAQTYLGLVIGHVIVVTPYIVSAVSAALGGVEPSLEDAARSLGAGPLMAFRRVTLPLIAPGILAGSVFGFVVSFGQFDLSLFLSTPDLEPLPIALYQTMRFKFDPSIAGAGVFAIVQLVISLLVVNHVFGLSRLTRAMLR